MIEQDVLRSYSAGQPVGANAAVDRQARRLALLASPPPPLSPPRQDQDASVEGRPPAVPPSGEHGGAAASQPSEAPAAGEDGEADAEEEAAAAAQAAMLGRLQLLRSGAEGMGWSSGGRPRSHTAGSWVVVSDDAAAFSRVGDGGGRRGWGAGRAVVSAPPSTPGLSATAMSMEAFLLPGSEGSGSVLQPPESDTVTAASAAAAAAAAALPPRRPAHPPRPPAPGTMLPAEVKASPLAGSSSVLAVPQSPSLPLRSVPASPSASPQSSSRSRRRHSLEEADLPSVRRGSGTSGGSSSIGGGGRGVGGPPTPGSSRSSSGAVLPPPATLLLPQPATAPEAASAANISPRAASASAESRSGDAAPAEADDDDDEAARVEARRQVLRDVLFATAAAEPGLRYTQGMNAAARLILLVVAAADDAAAADAAATRAEAGGGSSTLTRAPPLLPLPASVVAFNLLRGALHLGGWREEAAAAAASQHPLQSSSEDVGAGTEDPPPLLPSFPPFASSSLGPGLLPLFSHDMRALRLRLYQLDRLLCRRAPALHTHLGAEGLDPAVYAAPPLLTLGASFSVLDAGEWGDGGRDERRASSSIPSPPILDPILEPFSAAGAAALWDRFLVGGWGPVLAALLAALQVRWSMGWRGGRV